MIVLKTDRLIIRESSGRDFSRIYSMMLSEYRENENIASYGKEQGKLPAEAIRDVVSDDEDEELEKYLAYIHTVYSVFGFGLWSVCLKEDPDCVIGRCGLQPVADEGSPLGRIELGYLIDKKHRSEGYAYEACSAILDYAFSILGVERIFAVIDERNIASLKLARRLGFEKCEDGFYVLSR